MKRARTIKSPPKPRPDNIRKMASTWEDTVMSRARLQQDFEFEEGWGYGIDDWLKAVLESQAKDTWYARDNEVEEARKEGQREMVEYLSDGSLCEHDVAKKSCAICWHKKLVELGLEKQ
jgi:hypothetical protein